MVAQSSLAVLAGAMLTRWLAEQSIHDQSNALRLSRGDGVPQPIALEDHHTSLRRLHRLALKVQQALGVVTHHIDHSQPPPLERVAVEMRADAIARLGISQSVHRLLVRRREEPQRRVRAGAERLQNQGRLPNAADRSG